MLKLKTSDSFRKFIIAFAILAAIIASGVFIAKNVNLPLENSAAFLINSARASTVSLSSFSRPVIVDDVLDKAHTAWQNLFHDVKIVFTFPIFSIPQKKQLSNILQLIPILQNRQKSTPCPA
jgi:hypothetical protein